MGLTTTAAAVTDIARLLAADLEKGAGSRQKIDTRGQAWSWTSGLPLSLVDYVSPAIAVGLNYPVVLIKDSATPAAIVAEGASKPSGVSFSSTTVSLVKYAGRGEFSLEAGLNADGLGNVVYHVIAGQCIRALEKDAIAALLADKSSTIDSAKSLTDAVLGAQAEVLTHGGRPGVLVLSPAGYAEIMAGSPIGYAGASADPQAGPVPRIFGMAVHVSSALTAATTAYVLDPSSVIAIQHDASPLILTDPYSASDTNHVRLVVDLFAAVKVVSPGGVVQATHTPKP